MAEVISFNEGALSVRRRRQQELTRRCAEIVELNLRLAVELYSVAAPEEKRVRAAHVRQLAELLEYLA